jgi:hypothetical protein
MIPRPFQLNLTSIAPSTGGNCNRRLTLPAAPPASTASGDSPQLPTPWHCRPSHGHESAQLRGVPSQAASSSRVLRLNDLVSQRLVKIEGIGNAVARQGYFFGSSLCWRGRVESVGNSALWWGTREKRYTYFAERSLTRHCKRAPGHCRGGTPPR